MPIEIVTRIDDELQAAMQRLIPQLTQNHPPPDPAALQALLNSPGSLLLAARSPQGQVIGLLTLVSYRVPTGVRARIEDVVVDAAFRGQGIGQQLVAAALDYARALGADGVALTSNPRREAANHLYRKMGFRPWQTNLYFYKFKDSP